MPGMHTTAPTCPIRDLDGDEPPADLVEVIRRWRQPDAARPSAARREPHAPSCNTAAPPLPWRSPHRRVLW